MNNNTKQILTTYFSDIENNALLQKRINNDNDVMVFLLKVSRATEQAGEETTLSSRQKNMLYSAEHMLKIYDDIMKPASDIFVNIINNADANNENLLNILENPLYQNSFVYVGNDNIHKGLSDEEIRELRCTGSLSSIMPILEQSEKFYNEMSAQACFNYTKNIDNSFSQKSEHEQTAINNYILKHPKEIMALSFIAEKNRDLGYDVKIYNISDLAAKCEKDEVIELASKFSYIDRNESMEKYSEDAKPMPNLDKCMGIGFDVYDKINTPPKNNCRSF